MEDEEQFTKQYNSLAKKATKFSNFLKKNKKVPITLRRELLEIKSDIECFLSILDEVIQ